MPRHARSSEETNFFHVMTQGIEKSCIFNCSEDTNFYINLLKKYQKDYQVKIIAYCIMINHAHVLLKVKSVENLSRYMHKINGNYGMYYNDKYKRVGFVFRDRFRSEGIYGEEYYYNCIHYIYNNPVVAGICKKPEEYPYSNYKKINDYEIETMSFIDIDEERHAFNRKVIQDFLSKHSLDIKYLKYDKEKLKEIVEKLKNNHKMSCSEIANELQCSRSVIYRLLK